jgi:hypothetical protein
MTAVNKVVEKAPVIDYNIAEDGTITRTDKDSTITVATLKEDNTLVLVPEWVKFRAPIVRYLNEDVGRSPSAVYTEGDEPSPKAKARDIPPMPKMSMQLGDKTPEVVEWFKKYKPEEYRARYGIIGNGTVTKSRKVLNPKTGIPETEIYEADALIALRKTHLTEKVAASQGAINDSDYID